jgi:hypothetical protein
LRKSDCEVMSHINPHFEDDARKRNIWGLLTKYLDKSLASTKSLGQRALESS